MASQFPELDVLKKAERTKKKLNSAAQYDACKLSFSAALESKHVECSRLNDAFVLLLSKPSPVYLFHHSVRPHTTHFHVPPHIPFHLFFEHFLADPRLLHEMDPVDDPFSFSYPLSTRPKHSLVALEIHALSSDVRFRTFFDKNAHLVVYIEHPELYAFFSRHFAHHVEGDLAPYRYSGYAGFLQLLLPAIYVLKPQLNPGYNSLIVTSQMVYKDAVHAGAVFKHFRKHKSVSVPVPPELQAVDVYFPHARESSADVPKPPSPSHESRISERQLSKQKKNLQRKQKQKQSSIARRNARSNSCLDPARDVEVPETGDNHIFLKE